MPTGDSGWALSPCKSMSWRSVKDTTYNLGQASRNGASSARAEGAAASGQRLLLQRLCLEASSKEREDPGFQREGRDAKGLPAPSELPGLEEPSHCCFTCGPQPGALPRSTFVRRKGEGSFPNRALNSGVKACER